MGVNSKYIKLYDLMVVAPSQEFFTHFDECVELFNKVEFILPNSKREQNFAHLLVVCGEYEFLNSSGIIELLKSIQYIELIFFAPQEKDVLSLAIKHHAFGVYNIEDNVYHTLLHMLPALTKKANDLSWLSYFNLLMKSENSIVLFHKEDKIVYASDAFMRLFGLKNYEQAQMLIKEDPFIKHLQTDGFMQELYQVTDSSNIMSDYLLTHNRLKSSDGVFALLPFDLSIIKDVARVYNRVEFVDIFKKSTKATFVVIVNIENAKQILDLCSYKQFNDVSQKLSKLIAQVFDQNISIALWNIDTYVILSDEDLESIKQLLDILYEDLEEKLHIGDMLAYVDSFVLDVTKIELDRALEIIDNTNYNNIAAKDMGSILYYKLAFGSQDINSKREVKYYLEKMILEQHTIKVLNFYKGIKISSIAKLVKLVDGVLYISLEKMQGYAMEAEGSVIVQGANTPYDILAKVKFVDVQQKIAMLFDFKPMQTSANNRQYIRIQSDHRMNINLTFGKHSVSGLILDLSIKSIACKLNYASDFLKLNEVVLLQFSLPIAQLNNEIVSMSIRAKIKFIQKIDDYTKIVVDLMLEKPYDGYLKDYIYTKQQSLINEIKSIANRL